MLASLNTAIENQFRAKEAETNSALALHNRANWSSISPLRRIAEKLLITELVLRILSYKILRQSISLLSFDWLR